MLTHVFVDFYGLSYFEFT